MPRRNLATIRREHRTSSYRESNESRFSNVLSGRNQKHIIDKLYTTADSDVDWRPSSTVAIKIMISMRICSVVWGIIGDCDEVYNYWEPLHLFLYKSGFQTWEYSPIYAIRSYFFVLTHYVPAYFPSIFFGEFKVMTFYAVRCIVGAFCLIGEYLLFDVICKRISNSAGQNFVFLTISSAGLFISSTSFLPSSFAMSLNFYFLAAYLDENWIGAILTTVVSAFVGWPFSAVLGLPVFLDMVLIRKKYMKFIVYSVIFAMCIGLPMIVVDSFYFGKTVFAPLNILLYNVVSGPGPDLYGTEPLSFYIKNLILNHNISFPLSFVSIVSSMYCYMLYNPAKEYRLKFGIPRSLDYWKKYIPVFFVYLTYLTWLAIFFTQPHKEERFIFPVYPHILLLSSIAIDSILRIITRINEKLEIAYFIIICTVILLGASRCFAITRGYSAPIEVYKTLPDRLSEMDYSKLNDPIRICVGKEWYRFPSSFFIPDHMTDVNDLTKDVEFRFLRSAFRGLLPKPFMKSKNIVEITRNIPADMNDLNREETSRYVDIDSCDFVIDLDMDSTQYEIDFRENDKFEPIVQIPFMVASKSHTITRAFYVPFLTEQTTYWTNYTLYKRIYY